jgi:repressor LexA
MAIDQFPAEEELDLECIFKADRPYVLKVLGDSMIDDQICDGDYIVIDGGSKACANVKNCDHVIAQRSTGETTLCRWRPQMNGTVRLEKANKAFESVEVAADRVKVQGVVVGVLRSYA